MKSDLFLKKEKFKDKVARILIVSGGMLVIATVVLILFLILRVTTPLFLGDSHTTISIEVDKNKEFIESEKQSEGLLASAKELIDVKLSEYIDASLNLYSNGDLIAYLLKNGESASYTQSAKVVFKENLFSLLGVDARQAQILSSAFMDREFVVLLSGSRIIHGKFRFADSVFASDKSKVFTFEGAKLIGFEMDEDPERILLSSSPGGHSKAYLVAGNKSLLIKPLDEPDRTDLFADLTEYKSIRLDLPSPVKHFAVDKLGKKIAASRGDRSVYLWEEGMEEFKTFQSDKNFSAIGIINGASTLVVGDGNGEIRSYNIQSFKRDANLKTFKTLSPTIESPAVRFWISPRDKQFYVLSQNGDWHIYYLTHGERIHAVPFKAGPVIGDLSAKNNGFIRIAKKTSGENYAMDLVILDIPHPEASWKSFFSELLYENYDEPKYVWQSTGGSDQYEPKLSLVPLIFGTLKGTLYAMIFALPIAVLSAIYASQFLHLRQKKVIKPVVEMIASLPSVVIGFFIALWLAPIIQNHLMGFLSFLIVAPVIFGAFVATVIAIKDSAFYKKFLNNNEMLISLPVLVVCGWASYAAGPFLEKWFFGGNLINWLYADMGMVFDQRNCIITAFGLGFAVIPIIFSISEDALSTVPKNLSAASLALGASRWQTVFHIVLPSASPGIFAASMIGLGRAIGETMIVLMATGNTPIMDLSIFNGMRTLSANIAVEIPEAPVGGTLYRTLFLCAVILFIFTFIINTMAEVVREKLRLKYGKF